MLRSLEEVNQLVPLRAGGDRSPLLVSDQRPGALAHTRIAEAEGGGCLPLLLAGFRRDRGDPDAPSAERLLLIPVDVAAPPSAFSSSVDVAAPPSASSLACALVFVPLLACSSGLHVWPASAAFPPLGSFLSSPRGDHCPSSFSSSPLVQSGFWVTKNTSIIN